MNNTSQIGLQEWNEELTKLRQEAEEFQQKFNAIYSHTTQVGDEYIGCYYTKEENKAILWNKEKEQVFIFSEEEVVSLNNLFNYYTTFFYNINKEKARKYDQLSK